MKRTSTLALVAAISALAGSGTSRAQDAQQPTTRGSLVVAAGDKVHGFLRGGETHALRVHLSKGDVYSFSVDSRKRGDELVLHLTFLDPSGDEINSDARVVHYDGGKRVTVGPYRVPATGEYTLELYSQTWFSGDYWGTSKVRVARKSTVRLPTDGTTVAVDVSAGSTLRLRGGVGGLVVATPGAAPSQVTWDDPLVASLRAGTLASSETGVYRFGAPGRKTQPTIEVTRPRWKAITVQAPVLPDDPTRAADFAFVTDGWKEQHDAEILHEQQIFDELLKVAPQMAPPEVPAALIPVDAPDAASSRTATLFVGGGFDTSGALDTLFVPVAPPVVDLPAGGPPQNVEDPAVPPVVNPPVVNPPVVNPPVVDPPIVNPPVDPSQRRTDFGTPTAMTSAPSLQNASCVTRIAASGLLGFDNWQHVGVFISGNQVASANTQRDAPWTRSQPQYPADVVAALLPSGSTTAASASGDEPTVDGGVLRTFDIRTFSSAGMGTVQTVAHYFVDGHEVSGLLATDGDLSITWTVSGSGKTPAGVPFTIDGNWTMVMHGYAPTTFGYSIFSITTSRNPCTLSGSERYAAGDVSETVSIDRLDLLPVRRAMFVPQGTVVRTLDAPTSGIHQRMQIDYATRDIVVPNSPTIVPGLAADVKITTIDPSTPVDGVEDDETYEYQYHC
jgi:hypothetical protein